MKGVPIMSRFPRANPVLLLTIGLPAIAVLASFATLAVTLSHPESELPEQYHWEGFQLDRDFTRGEHAGNLQVHATVAGLDRGGQCVLNLAMRDTPPQTLRMTIAHATLPARDSSLTFDKITDVDAGEATYAARCSATDSGHWRVELSDAADTWSVRDSVHGTLSALSLDAGSASQD
jgi:hypothetical protein